MAQHRGRQGEWPIVKREPNAFVLVPDVYERTDRGIAALRFGTSRDGVGPRGSLRRRESSDFETDRVSPREFDPMGTSIERYTNAKRDADLISAHPARRTERNR